MLFLYLLEEKENTDHMEGLSFSRETRSGACTAR